jgi:hypothetical protein
MLFIVALLFRSRWARADHSDTALAGFGIYHQYQLPVRDVADDDLAPLALRVPLVGEDLGERIRKDLGRLLEG